MITQHGDRHSSSNTSQATITGCMWLGMRFSRVKSSRKRTTTGMQHDKVPQLRSAPVIFPKNVPTGARNWRLPWSLSWRVSTCDVRQMGSGIVSEVNPSPGFTYYQDITHQRIDEAIARLLARGKTTSNSVGLRRPAIIVPPFALNVFPQVLQR